MIWIGYFICLAYALSWLYVGILMYKRKQNNRFLTHKNRYIIDEYRLSKYHGILMIITSIIYIVLFLATIIPSKSVQQFIKYSIITLSIVFYIMYTLILNRYSKKSK